MLVVMVMVMVGNGRRKETLNVFSVCEFLAVFLFDRYMYLFWAF